MHLWPSPRKPPCHSCPLRVLRSSFSSLPHNFAFFVAPRARLPRRLRARSLLDLNRPIVSQLLLVVLDFLLSCCSKLPICVDCSCLAQTFLHVLEMAYSSRAMQQQAGVAVFVVLAAALILGVAAQNNPSTACGQYETPLANCLDFLTNTAQTPSTSCCSAISQVHKESVTCLCSIVTNIGTSVPINVTRAKEIPQDCNLGFTNTVCEGKQANDLLTHPLCMHFWKKKEKEKRLSPSSTEAAFFFVKI